MASDPPFDADVAAWVEAQPRQFTYSELAAACLSQFGPERAWDAAKLRRYWHARPREGRVSPIERDTELLAFLRDREGRLTGPDLLAQCAEHFPAERVPSRSALYRWISRARARRSLAQSDAIRGASGDTTPPHAQPLPRAAC